MASISEGGHGKNVANFGNLINLCNSYGQAYNPGTNSLQIPQLQNLLVSAQQSVTVVLNNYNEYKKVTNDREIVFDPVKKLAIQVIATLKSCGANKQTIDDAVAINRKIQGRRAKLTKADAGKNTPVNDSSSANALTEATEKKTASVSQQSFDLMVEHVTKLVALLSITPQYTPNEAQLSVAGLTNLAGTMKTANESVIVYHTNWSNSRIVRDEILYKNDSGLVDTGKAVKNYIKGVFGNKSPQYKQASSIVFRKIS